MGGGESSEGGGGNCWVVVDEEVGEGEVIVVHCGDEGGDAGEEVGVDDDGEGEAKGMAG